MVNKNTDLYKLIDNLKNKIKKLDSQKNKISTNILAYRICYPNKLNNSKKYIGLSFNENFDDFESDIINNINSNIPFIKIKKSNCIINFSITFDIINISSDVTICSISLGIKDKKTSKIRIIKGSKICIDISNKSIIINNSLTINNTIIYMANDEDELCMIAELNNKIKINSKKSLIKIFYS